jgi:pyruvate/2-oxoglutarate dehydrogenase complex dihydrolipoamide acyltransferase (E2) component
MILYKGRIIRSQKTLGKWRRFALHLWEPPRDPTITYSVQYDGTTAIRYIDEVRARTAKKITLTHLFIKGLGLALTRYPELNVRVVGRKLHQLPTVSLCMPSFVENGKELHYFCIEDVARKSLSQICDEIQERANTADQSHDSLSADLPGWMLSLLTGLDRLLTRHLDVRLRPFRVPDVSVTPIMFSAAGRFARFHNTTGALFPGNTAIFILGTATKKPVVVDDEVVIRPMIPFGMSADHRIIDGYSMSRYTDFLEEFVKDPARFVGDDV